MFDDFEEGAQLGDASSYVRFRRESERRPDDLMTSATIEVKAGPFTGAVRDDSVVGVAEFCDALRTLHRTLSGSATLSTYEKFKLTVSVGTLGGIHCGVEIYGGHVPLSKLIFEMHTDQTFIPKFIRDMKLEFPEG